MRTSDIYRLARVLLLFLAVLIVAASPGLASSHEKTTVAEVIAEAKDTSAALKSYTAEQRAEALQAAKEKLDTLDLRIAELQQNLLQRWQTMSKASREETQQSLKKLRQQRETAAEWFGGMRHSSIEAWEEVKEGFGDSYDRLQKAFNDAQKSFEK